MTGLINGLLNILTIIIFARVILSFVVPMMGARPHPAIVTINSLVNQVSEPILGPIRRTLPSFGGLDLSPMAVLIIIWLVRAFIVPRL
ncbi:MAG: YggT family protein [Dehalococcoidia bacterium]